eukprot:1028314-Rhodomonas_salina.1
MSPLSPRQRLFLRYTGLCFPHNCSPLHSQRIPWTEGRRSALRELGARAFHELSARTAHSLITDH